MNHCDGDGDGDTKVTQDATLSCTPVWLYSRLFTFLVWSCLVVFSHFILDNSVTQTQVRCNHSHGHGIRGELITPGLIMLNSAQKQKITTYILKTSAVHHNLTVQRVHHVTTPELRPTASP